MKLAIRMTLTLCLLAAGLCAQTTYYVDQANPSCPGDGSQGNPFCTIQQGINAASSGDTILVLPGTYFENLNFLGKALTLTGQAGADSTIIDGNRAGRVVTIEAAGSSPGCVIEGVTVINGRSPTAFGGGIYCTSSALLIRDCIIRLNVVENAVGHGGGIYCDASSLTVLSSEIRGNRADGDFLGRDFGGGIYATSSTVLIEGNDIRANTGGGVYSLDSTLTVTDNLVFNNSGRGIAFSGPGDVLIEDNTIERNNAGGWVAGGGISGDSFGQVTIRSNVILRNDAIESSGDFLETAYGGGIYLAQGGSALVEGNDIRLNRARSSLGTSSRAYGGGLYLSEASLTLNGNLFEGNLAEAINSMISMNAKGGGAYTQLTGSLLIQSNRFVDNVVDGGSDQAGGGAYIVQAGLVEVVANRFSGNQLIHQPGLVLDQSVGAGVAAFGDDVRMIENVLVDNSLPDSTSRSAGGGAYVGATSAVSIGDTYANNAVGPVAGLGGGLYLNGTTAVIENAIVWGNAPDQIHVAAGSATVTFSDVQGGFPGTGNINSDPLFIDAPNGDYRLSCASPCIDAGTNATSLPLPAFDVSGLDRRQIGPFVDMGADEAGVFWSFNGPAIAGGPPVDFTLMAAPGHPSPAISEVFLSFGDGDGTGLPVPLSGGRRIGLSADSLLSFWLSLPSPVRQVAPNGCSGATTASVSLPASAPVGITFYWAGIAWDLGAGTVTSITPTQSDVTQ